jgi:hypothetical protein
LVHGTALIFILLLIGLPCSASTQKKPKPVPTTPSALSNADVVRFAQFQSPCMLVMTIQQNRSNFDLSNAALRDLKARTVDPAVLSEMFQAKMRDGEPAENVTSCADGQRASFAPPAGTNGNGSQPAWTPIANTGTGTPTTPQQPAIANPQASAGGQGTTPNSGVPAPPPVLSELTPQTQAAVAMAINTTLNFDINNPDVPDQHLCVATDKFCIQLDWATKTPSKDNVLRRTGTYRFHIINLNTPLYDYTVQGQSNKAGNGNDFALLQDAVSTVSNFLGQQSTTTQAVNAANKKVGPQFAVQHCTVEDNLQTATAKAQALQTALNNFGVQSSAKDIPSVSLQTATTQWNDVMAAYRDFAASVTQLKADLQTKGTANCSDQQASAAVALITDKAPTIRAKVNVIDQKIHGDHTLDRQQYCERTAGCSISITENFNGKPTTVAQGNPFVLAYDPFYSQLSVDGGFLLTTLPALSYTSQTAPDPANPTTATQNVLAVNGNSGIRPALAALLTYHLPWRFLDSINQGLGISSGPVIEIANGKADTSKFGFYAGGTAHIWNRFFMTVGTHVGEFADFPQGFTHAGQVIPSGTGTPTPTKRYTARLAFGITYTLKDLSTSGDNAQKTTKAAEPSGSGSSTKSAGGKQ